MGLELGHEQIRLEKRLGNIFIRRDLGTGNVYVSVEGVIGFYDSDGKWHSMRSEAVELSGDAVAMVFGITPDRVGNPRRLGDFLAAVAYGILSGAIPTNAVLTVSATSADGTPIPANVAVIKDGVLYGSGEAGQPMHLPVLLGATVTVTSLGYRQTDISVPVLAGSVNLNVTLEPVEPSG